MSSAEILSFWLFMQGGNWELGIGKKSYPVPSPQPPTLGDRSTGTDRRN
ncbi:MULTISPECIES: hypothetical protein [Cyanophyceae]|nr:hypothetical protein [Trichocoleus sp. FACHB-69]MBD1930786.1 hypothetical protein [Trichocoleus sp. FACHB-69]